MNDFKTACSCLPRSLRAMLDKLPLHIKQNATEIVMRKEDSFYIVCKNIKYFIAVDGSIRKNCRVENRISEDDIANTILRACGYSLYAHQNELMKGFVSIGDGCRMALVGNYGYVHDVFADFSVIEGIKIRIARDMYFDSSFIFSDNSVASTLIVGPPASGKTTMLRSIARWLSDNNTDFLYSISIVDERGEIFPSTMKKPSCADVISGISKAEGMNIAVRLYSPQVLICDEIGTLKEANVIKDSLNSGVIFICSMHAKDENELSERPCFKNLWHAKVFSNIVFLSGSDDPGTIKRIVRSREICFA